MTELDILEGYLISNGITYRRRPVFDGMPKGPEQICVSEHGARVWNVISDCNLLEYTGPDGAMYGLTAKELIQRIEE